MHPQETVKLVVPTTPNIDWAQLLKTDGISITSIAESTPKNIVPNRLAVIPEHPGVGVLVVFQSSEDFAIGKAGLDYILEALRAGRIREAHVLLIRKDGNSYVYVNAAPAEKVAEALAKVQPRDGRWGEYWWVPSTLFPDDPPF